eukprot:COSAG06_NODE_65490_length_257_cov_0.487342_1_plen_46_part_01
MWWMVSASVAERVLVVGGGWCAGGGPQQVSACGLSRETEKERARVS